MKVYKIILFLSILVSLISALQYTYEQMDDSIKLYNKSYLEKQDYVEGKYNGYLVYRYYDWIKISLPKAKTYGILTATDDNKTYGRYMHRLNYFLYPEHITETGTIFLLAPKLSSVKLYSEGRSSYGVLAGKKYFLISKKDGAGLLRLK